MEIKKITFGNSEVKQVQFIKECVLVQFNLLNSQSSSSEVKEFVSKTIKETNKYLRWRCSCQEAEIWLSDRERRCKLAVSITNRCFKDKSLVRNLTLKSREDIKDKFLLDFYECLNWLCNTLKTSVPNEITIFRQDLLPLKEFYIEALLTLKEKVKKSKDLKNKDDVVNVICAAINLLIKKISP